MNDDLTSLGRSGSLQLTTMPLLSASADTFILAVVTIAVFMYRKSSPNNVRPRFRSITTAFIAIHAIWIIYVLCFFRPPNLFTRLHIPLSTPSDRIRALILKRENLTDVGLPDHLEELLTRLSSFDLRTFYIRCLLPLSRFQHPKLTHVTDSVRT